MNQLLGTIRCFVQFWEPGELNTVEEQGTIEERKCAILQMNHEATCIINAPSSDHPFITVRSDGFKPFVCSELGAVHKCQIAKNSKKFKEVVPIAPDSGLTNNKSEEYL